MADHAYKEAKTPRSKGKKLHHLEVHPAENGGHVIRHHYHDDGLTFHRPTEHVFGEDEGAEAMDHIAKHANIRMPSAEEEEAEGEE